MSSGREEVDAAVDSAVENSPLAADMQLLSQVFLILFVDVCYYRLPAVERSSREELLNDFNILVI